MNNLESFVVLARFMGAHVTHGQKTGGTGYSEGHYPYNEDYQQDGVLFTFRPVSDGENQIETSPDLFRNFSSASVKYHKSLDWLMPVVKRVQKEDFPELSLVKTLEKLLGEKDLDCFSLFLATASHLYNTRPHLYTELKEPPPPKKKKK